MLGILFLGLQGHIDRQLEIIFDLKSTTLGFDILICLTEEPDNIVELTWLIISDGVFEVIYTFSLYTKPAARQSSIC